jgi:diguanylate cyclase (GGDEF)-like protein
MNWAAARRAISWVVPEGVILGAAVISLRHDALRDRMLEFAPLYPFAVFGLGVLLAMRFQRSRLVFALLLLALAEWGLDYVAPGEARRFAFRAAAVLLPLNLAAIALMKERGTFTRPGLMRLGIIVAQAAGIAAAVRYALPRATAIAGHQLLPAGWFTWTPVPQNAVIAFAAAGLLVGLAIVFQASGAARPFLWALAAAFLALQFAGTPAAATIYRAVAGLILVVAVIEASYLMAYQDGLTGLPARRALNEALQRMDGQFTIAMVDVDHFKKLNDRYGHDVGDQVLRMVATQLANVNGGGRAFRYGGEEFAVLFPGKGVAECVDELEMLRQAVEDSAFTVRRRLRPRRKPANGRNGGGGRQQIAVTVSIGAAEPNGRGATAEEVVRAADRALYRAKDGGRNRVES